MVLSCHLSLIPVVSELSSCLQASDLFCLLHRLIGTWDEFAATLPSQGERETFSIMLSPVSFASSLFRYFSGVFGASIPTEPSLKTSGKDNLASCLHCVDLVSSLCRSSQTLRRAQWSERRKTSQRPPAEQVGVDFPVHPLWSNPFDIRIKENPLWPAIPFMLAPRDTFYLLKVSRGSVINAYQDYKQRKFQV